MKIPLLPWLIIISAVPALANEQHAGMVVSNDGKRLVLLEKGASATYSLKEQATCYTAGEPVTCSKIRRNSVVRLECRDSGCYRVVVDSEGK